MENAIGDSLEPVGHVGLDARRFAGDVDGDALGLRSLLSPFDERGGHSRTSMRWMNSHGAEFPRWGDVSR